MEVIIEIPKNATNGEIMHILFPNTTFVIGDCGFDPEWWDATHQSEVHAK